MGHVEVEVEVFCRKGLDKVCISPFFPLVVVEDIYLCSMDHKDL
jgi:hypothetical protein